MITYSWKNIELSCHHSMYGKSNVAFSFSATLTATDSEGITREKKISGGFGEPGNNYIDSGDITKENAIEWIESALGDILEREKKDLELQLTVFKIIRFD